MAGPSLDAVLPNSQHLLLLHAALGTGDKARLAWDQWLTSNDLDALDSAAFRLLPLVYRNLNRHDASGELDPRVKGAYRYWWVRQRRLLSAVHESLCALQGAGIPTLLLKGVPLAHLVYSDPASRTMEDADLCVPLPDLKRALRVLEGLGWKTRREEDELCDLRHEVTLKRGDHVELDLQRFAFESSRWHGFNELIFARANMLEINGLQTLAPRFEDHLIIVCSHGMRWSRNRTFQWIPDAVLLLRHVEQQHSTFDWEAVVKTCQSVHLCAPLHDALSYIQTHFGAPVPDKVLRALHNTREAAIFRAEYHAKLQPNTLQGTFWRHAALYTRIYNHSGQKLTPLGYCQKYWNITSPLRVPADLRQRSRNIARSGEEI